MTRLGARDVVLTSEASADLAALEGSPDKVSGAIARRARALRAILLADCLHGEVVRKDRLPRALRARFRIENLYVEDLPGFWRLLYTVVREGNERCIVVLRIVDHPTYSRWFPGKGR